MIPFAPSSAPASNGPVLATITRGSFSPTYHARPHLAKVDGSDTEITVTPLSGMILYNNDRVLVQQVGSQAIVTQVVSSEGDLWLSLNGSGYLLGGWLDYNSSSYRQGTVQRVNGHVELSGLLKSGGSSPYFAGLPLGYRPSQALFFSVRAENTGSSSTSATVTVQTDGGCQLDFLPATGYWLQLDGIRFLADVDHNYTGH